MRRAFPSCVILFILAGCAGSSYTPAVFNGKISSQGEDSSIILLGDTQRTGFWETLILREQNDDARRAVLNRIAEEHPSALVILGDLVSNGASEVDWRLFDEFTSPIREKHIPTYPLLGNHEYFGDDQQALRNYFSRFPYVHERQWYTFTVRSIGFILLNSNFDKLTNDQLLEQERWYKQTLEDYQQNDSITTIIVCCHQPPFTNSTVVSDDENVRKFFVPPYINTPKAKLFFTGHCHSYERFIESGKTFIVSGGGGGPRQAVETDSTKQRHYDQYKGKRIRDFHFCKIIIERNQLKVQMIEVDESLKNWKVGDEIILTQ